MVASCRRTISYFIFRPTTSDWSLILLTDVTTRVPITKIQYIYCIVYIYMDWKTYIVTARTSLYWNWWNPDKSFFYNKCTGCFCRSVRPPVCLYVCMSASMLSFVWVSSCHVERTEPTDVFEAMIAAAWNIGEAVRKIGLLSGIWKNDFWDGRGIEELRGRAPPHPAISTENDCLFPITLTTHCWGINKFHIGKTVNSTKRSML